MVPRKQAGHMTCTRPQAERQILLATRASSTHDPQRTLKGMTEASGVPSLTSARASAGHCERSEHQRLRWRRRIGRLSRRAWLAERVLDGRRRHRRRRSPLLRHRRWQCTAARKSITDLRSVGHRRAGGAAGRISRHRTGSTPWERQFGEPVMHPTNQATLWAVLRAMRVDTPLSGKGRLLEQMPECRRRDTDGASRSRNSGRLAPRRNSGRP